MKTNHIFALALLLILFGSTDAQVIANSQFDKRNNY